MGELYERFKEEIHVLSTRKVQEIYMGDLYGRFMWEIWMDEYRFVWRTRIVWEFHVGQLGR